jgi:hypothetical protein
MITAPPSAQNISTPAMDAVLVYLAKHGGIRSANRYRSARPGEFQGMTIGALRRRGWVDSCGQLGDGGPLYTLTKAGADKIRERRLLVDDAKQATS